jgi:anti-sigma B factor antagonist
MLKHIAKLFGGGSDEGARAERLRAEIEADMRARREEMAAQGVELPPTDRMLKTETLGQTLVATIIEPDLTAPKVADLSDQLRLIMSERTGTRHLVLDLQNVEYLDSSCLNFFVELLTRVKHNGGRIGVAAVAQRVEVLFKLTRLDLVFSIRRTVFEAIEAVEREG